MKLTSEDRDNPASGSGLGTRASQRLLFAYGSNMNAAQIQARCGWRPKVVGVARLADHQLAFYGHSKRWDGALETVDRQPGGEVWGVVYALNFSDAERLDTHQDARMDGAGAYFHYPTEVVTAEGQPLDVVLYKKDQVEEHAEPSREYLEFILQGAEEQGLPAGYVAAVRAMAAHPARYEVPRKSKYDNLLAAGCTDCGDLRAAKGGPGFKAVPVED